MSTNSTIALEFADGTVQAIYCHWDGYLDFNGKILMKHYRDPFKVRDLIDLGYLSSLGPEIGVEHPFASPFPYGTAEYNAERAPYRGMCTFYARDRGDEIKKAATFKSFLDYAVNVHEKLPSSSEYNYILRRDGVWYVSEYGSPFITVEQALAEQQESC